jgi:hypothetical protein
MKSKSFTNIQVEGHSTGLDARGAHLGAVSLLAGMPSSENSLTPILGRQRQRQKQNKPNQKSRRSSTPLRCCGAVRSCFPTSQSPKPKRSVLHLVQLYIYGSVTVQGVAILVVKSGDPMDSGINSTTGSSTRKVSSTQYLSPVPRSR